LIFNLPLMNKDCADPFPLARLTKSLSVRIIVTSGLGETPFFIVPSFFASIVQLSFFPASFVTSN